MSYFSTGATVKIGFDVGSTSSEHADYLFAKLTVLEAEMRAYAKANNLVFHCEIAGD